MIKTQFYNFIKELQDTITSRLEQIDGKAVFQEDQWHREEGGGGFTRVIENGTVFEKGGVNISEVHGPLPVAMQSYFNVGDVDFYATGLSLVIHPVNPHVPTVHANFRYFEMYDKESVIVDSWFGGGLDLTPYYLYDEDASHFHQVCKTVCDRHSVADYSLFKEKCDTYFHNSHRGEGRGIGGLFYDYCKANKEYTMEEWLAFQKDIASHFLDAYAPIATKRKDLKYTSDQRDWQEIRRGRYVEFNLVHDKGTLFGLKTNGRIESILMSLPPHVQWRYDYHPEPNTPEADLIEVLKSPKDWV
ncbi:coproporphyrinogen III oxidase [Flavobacteria bacterium BBFL7]|nr:coproporphyrinogen III oxidase [Flavobacteria bacterium BBFL7]